LVAISVFVTSAHVPVRAARPTRWVAAWAPLGRPAQSGHLIPTGAYTMQSVQIGRPQLEQLTAVSRPGCR
jgi:hypothetical protein